MSTPVTELPTKKKHTPYVPETMQMKEFTLRALLIGMVLTAVLGSANAYLGLRAGMTIAATYPAAVIGMALLRLMKGSLLEENIARTIGTIGESVAAGAVFTIPAFVMAGLWEGGLTPDKYWKSRLGRRGRDSQGRPTGGESGKDSVCQYGFRRIHVSPGPDQHLQPLKHVSREDRRTRKETAAPH